MNRRIATLVTVALDAAVWLAVVAAAFLSRSDPATRGLDQAAAWLVTALFVITGAPALALALLRRAPRSALAFALAFPAALVAAFVAAIVALR